MNPSRVPDGLFQKDDSPQQPASRQVVLEDLPLALAVLDLAAEGASSFHAPLRYVEAQVGGVPGDELFQKARKTE